MKIAYVANHGCGGNDDEGAIRYALERLGHQVQAIPERSSAFTNFKDADLVLFHKWANPHVLRRAKAPRVFWYFDLVDWPDPWLATRNRNRLAWMNQIVPRVDLGFCTDGDWVDRHNPECKNKLVWLPQGADERVVGAHPNKSKSVSLLFTGIGRAGGSGRQQFLKWMQDEYPEKFHHQERGIYRGALQDLIGRTKVVIAPDSPVTDKYWSNRVYNAAGFGACVLHPFCDRLSSQYTHPDEIVFYVPGDRENLRTKIDHLLGDAPGNREFREEVGMKALLRTQTEHLYRHRCETMLKVIKERLGVG